MKPFSLAPLLLLTAMPILGCSSAPPVATAATNNPSVPVEELLTHDGCTIYRFQDQKYEIQSRDYHYYVHCREPAPAAGGKQAAAHEAEGALTISRVSCGKACTRDETVPTVSR